jgi:cytoskeletal protein RodZ
MVTAGEVLKTKRESLGKTLQQISQETKIQERFLEYIEENAYEKFDSDVFVSGFIKIYSENLGLDTERVLALYRRGNGHIYQNKKGKGISQKAKKKNIFTPKNIAIAVITISLIGILIYIGYQIFLFQNPPTISITEPNNNITADEETLTIKGDTTNTSYILNNETKTIVEDNGCFSLEYTLTEGENDITITAVKENTGQEAVTNLVITYIPKEEEEVAKETTDEYILKLIIENDVAWIKLDVDGVNKISQVLEPSEREYTIQDRFEIISGRPSNTQVYINEEEYELVQDPSNGTYKLSCEILQTGPVCR